MTLDLADFLRRTSSARDTGRYRLGAGSLDPSSPTPLDRNGECDCSAYVFWAWARSKRLPPGVTAAGYGTVNTTAMVADAKGKQRVVALVPVGADVRLGDAVVYGGIYATDPRTKVRKRVRPGHTGVVVGMPDGWAYTGPAALGLLRVSHCNAGPAPAIDETNGRAWALVGVVVRLVD